MPIDEPVVAFVGDRAVQTVVVVVAFLGFPWHC